MTYSGGKKTHADVLLLGNSTSSTSDLRIGRHAVSTGCFKVFVGGGEQSSHQAPPDGSPSALIVRTDP